MKFRRFTAVPFCLCLVLPLLAGLPLAAAEFPPITDEERALTAVPGEPNAPAVVLFKKGEFLMMGYGLVTGSSASHLKVQTRVKILTEAGISNGEIVIAHSDSTRLENFEGRTVLPDGRVVPVPADAKFIRKTSRSRKTFVTAMAFPAVEVGAILDYQYELVFTSRYFLEPWYFSEDVPVRYSEIVFKSASGWRMWPWDRSPFGVKIQQEQEKTSRGTVLRAWAENLPAVPDDPYGPPYADLATQMRLLPTERAVGASATMPLLRSWPMVVKLIGSSYSDVQRKDAGVAQQARKIAATGTAWQKAEALYRFVRDEIETEPDPGIFVDPEASLREILSERRGDPAEKALLLQSMLKAVQMDSDLVWAGERENGAIDTKLPNPGWFDTVLVRLMMDGGRVFLDASDRALGFGQVRAGYEGMPALVLTWPMPTGVLIPESPFDQNLKRATVDLALDDQGRLTGRGTVLLTGHYAWERIDWQEDDTKTLQAWKDWLSEHYRDYQISEVNVVEAPDERKVTVTWSMAQREEEVLGDEASISPCAPLGPLAQPFVQPASARRTAVVLDFPDRQEVVLRLLWPEDWKIEALPKDVNLVNAAGSLSMTTEMNDGERTLVYTRRFDVKRRVHEIPQGYEVIRSLYSEVEKNDAQKLLLVRR